MGIFKDIINRLKGPKHWNKWSKEYDKYIVNRDTAYEEARLYEDFEDSLILTFLKHLFTKTQNNFTFIEAGSGTGRYMDILGCKMVKNANRPTNGIYEYDPEFENHLKLIIGIDFAEGMIKVAKNKLSEHGLNNLIDKKIKFYTDYIQNIKFEEGEIIGERFVCCMFGTFGNIPKEDRQKALKSMKEMTGDGILLISVFNREMLKELGKSYYENLKGLFGNPMFDFQNGDVKTDQGFEAHWFTIGELCNAAKEINFREAYIIIGKELGKINNKDATRGLILVASNKKDLKLKEMLESILKDMHAKISPNVFYKCK